MNYREEENKRLIKKTNEIIENLPSFCREFFIDMDATTLPATRCAYAVDLKLFFNYLTEYQPKFQDKYVKDISVSDMNNIKAITIKEYLYYLTNYETEVKGAYERSIVLERNNAEKGKSRKLAAVRRLLKYLYMEGYISDNPGELVATPKIREKAITRLEPNEVADLLDEVEQGKKLSEHQSAYHERTKERDLAIVSLLLGTGIRVSECVGINIGDINFEECSFKITRKGGKEVVLYYGDEVSVALEGYMAVRKEIKPKEGSEDALFLSMQNKRITTRAVQNLVKKYSSLSVAMKNISPHKLRSTYGTELYNEKQDIYLVADVLGHSDVNVTKRHYVAQADENRRIAARAVKLRKE